VSPSFAIAGKIRVGPGSRQALPGHDLPHGCAQRGCEVAGGLRAALCQIVTPETFDLCDSLTRKPHGSDSPARLVIGGGKLGILAFQTP
jgi:hypothetical protein